MANVTTPAASADTPSATVKATFRSLRSCSRQGSRFMRGMSVETPQCEATGREERRSIALHCLSLGAGGQLHLSERIALLRRNAHPAGDDIGHARNVGAAAADHDLLRLLAARDGCQVELQGATHLLCHVVNERIEHFRLVVARQTALFLCAPRLLHG